MKKTLPIVLAIALICALVVSCGPSQAMQDAQSTQTAAAIYATQTAQAPTNTATATSTATSTLTPTITPTPTQTPTPLPTATPTPKIYTGEWHEYSFSEFQISLPENWKTIDINKEGIEAIRDLIQSIDTVWAQNMEPLITAEGMEEMLKLWAMDPEPAGVGYATVNITSQELPIANSTKSMSRQLESAFEQMGVEVLDIETDLLINNFDSARITLRLTMGPFSVKEYVYLFSVGQTMWVITFAVDETASYDYEGLFETVANSFHVVE